MKLFKNRPVTRFSLIYSILGLVWFTLPRSVFNQIGFEFTNISSFDLWHDLIFVLLSSILIYNILKKEKAAQEIIRRSRDSSENLYGNILKEIQDSVLIYNLDQKKIQLYSDETASFFEIPLDDIKQNFELILERIHPEDRDRISEVWSKETDSSGILYRLLFPDGRIKWALENRKFFVEENSEHRYIISVLRDVTVYLKNQEELKNKVSENQILLTEVHHRVKNNLAIIVSFLQLQAYSTTPETSGILNQSVSRVKAIALVHEKIYGTKNLNGIEAGNYFVDLANNVRQMYSQGNLEIQVDSSPILLDLTSAIPLGLLINEMLTNSMRHGFQEDSQGKIVISMQLLEDGSKILRYADNGVGFPNGFIPEKATSIGLTIVFGLVSQLFGKVVPEKPMFETGVSFSFRFYNTKEEWKASDLQ